MSVEKKLLPDGPDRIKIHVPRKLATKAYLEYYDEEGKRQRIYAGLSAPKTYEGRVALAERTMRAFVAAYVPLKSLDDRAWDWIAAKKPNWRPKSYLCYCSKLRIFQQWKDGREMSPLLITEFFRHIEQKLSNGTRNDYLRYLKQIYTAVADQDYFGHIDRLRHHPQVRKRYQRAHRQIIREHLEAYDPELLFACRCISYLFLRPASELRLLQVMHFELDEWRLFIPAHISKNGKDGYVIIPEEFREELVRYLLGKKPNDFLFPGKKKAKPVGVNTLSNRYRKHMNTLGFGPEFTLYGWKNTGNFLLADKGVSLLYIQQQNRHSNLEITSIYLRDIGWRDMGSLAADFPEVL